MDLGKFWADNQWQMFMYMNWLIFGNEMFSYSLVIISNVKCRYMQVSRNYAITHGQMDIVCIIWHTGHNWQSSSQFAFFHTTFSDFASVFVGIFHNTEYHWTAYL